MKEKDMKKLALLGITAGLLIVNQPAIEAIEDSHFIDLNYILAKPSCKAHGGCGGLTASRDRNEKSDSAEKDNDEEEQEESKKNFPAPDAIS